MVRADRGRDSGWAAEEWAEAAAPAAQEVEEVREQAPDPGAVGLAQAEQVCGEPEEAAEAVRVVAARVQAARAADQASAALALEGQELAEGPEVGEEELALVRAAGEQAGPEEVEPVRV